MDGYADYGQNGSICLYASRLSVNARGRGFSKMHVVASAMSSPLVSWGNFYYRKLTVYISDDAKQVYILS
jgi:hypothetical protein